MAFLLPSATFISRKADGTPNALGKVYTYAAGTLTPQDSYTTAGLDVEHENPIILDPAGTARIWLDPTLTYRIREYTSADVLIRDTDNISPDGADGTVMGRYVWEIEEQESTEGQDEITLTEVTLNPGSGAQQIIVDGLVLAPSYYTVDDATTVTLAVPLSAGQEIQIIGGRYINAALDSSEVAYIAGDTGAVARTAQEVLREHVSVRDFGDAGEGGNDSTIAQLALDSGAKVVTFPPGRTYLVSGLNMTTNGQTIIAHGATLKLPNSAAQKDILHVTGTDCLIEGGTWDGNKANGNAPVDTYESYAVGLYADRCTVRGARVYNFHGIGLKGLGNYLTFEGNNISGTTHYGVFVDGAAATSYRGNRAIGNTIDMTDGGTIGQGILFTAVSGQNQLDWELSGNNVSGPQGVSIADQAINLAVRGKDGIVANNRTRHGSMGFSEGGDNCVISGNRFLELKGTVRIGIEPSGRFTAVGNTITDAYVGIDATATVDFDDSVVTGNQITAVSGGSVSYGVRFQIASTYTGANIAIAGNVIRTNHTGVYLVGDVTTTGISGNIFVGPGVSSGRGVFLDTVNLASNISINANTFVGFQRAWSVYSLAANTYTYLRAANNTTTDCGGDTTWLTEGSAVIGAWCSVLGSEGGTRDMFNAATNAFMLKSASYSNPEGSLTAGIGSLHISLNSAGGVYYKSTGTGNTGWVAL